MKKLTYCLGIITVSLLLFSCKSKDVDVSKDDVLEEPTEVVIEEQEDVPGEEPETEKVVEIEEKNDKDIKEKETDKTDEEKVVSDKKIAFDENGRNLVGWIDIGEKNPMFESGIVRICTNSKLGTFCIYAINENGKAYPVLSTLNEFSTTEFSLKIGKKIVKLSANEKVDVTAKELKDGISICYSLKNAKVILTMTVFPSVKGRNPDTIKFNVRVSNEGTKTETFGLKAVLDTILGERGSYHFYNSEGKPVRNEVSFRELDEERWFLSKNDKVSMQLLFHGGDTTMIDFVTLANYDTLEKSKWFPDMHGEGAFDTVLSYNNSAVGIVWPSKKLFQNDSFDVNFYVSLSLYGANPNGDRYVYGLKNPNINQFSGIESIIGQEEVEQRNSGTLHGDNTLPFEISYEIDNTEPEPEVKESLPVAKDKYSEKDYGENRAEVPEETDEVTSIEFNVKNISKDHLTQEYIESLIERIAELEASGSSLNRSEILQLNAELDAILSILR